MGQKEGEQLRFPKDVFRRDSFIKRNGRKLLLFGSSAILLAEVGYWVNYTAQSIIDNGDSVDTPPTRERGVDGLISYYLGDEEGLDGDETKAVLIDNYKLAKNGFIDFANYQLKTDYSEGTLDFLRKERWTLIVDGANILNRISQDQILEFNNDEGYIKYTGEDLTFRQGNAFEEFVVQEIITQELITRDNRWFEQERSTARSYLEDLVWLARADLPIKVEQDSFVFPHAEILINMARFYKTIKDLGYPLPEEIDFTPFNSNSPGAGWYQDDRDEIFVTERGSDSTIVHEGAHNQADENKVFSQEAFSLIVEQALKKGSYSYNDSGNFYINPDVLAGASKEGALIENYAETISTYFTDGIHFRHRLKELYMTDNAAYNILRTQYDCAKMFFGDREYLLNGEIFNPKVGDVFEVDDPDTSGRGITLRPEVASGITEDDPIVSDLEYLRIVDGPEYKYFEGTERSEKWWKVELVFPEGEGVYDPDMGEGWIREIWFGRKILSSEINNQQ